MDNRDESSLVDLFIQNSRPENRRSNFSSQEFRTGPSGPVLGQSLQEQLYLAAPVGEQSHRHKHRKMTS